MQSPMGRNFLHFPPRNSLGLLVYCRAHFSVLETFKIVCVAICLRLNHKMTRLARKAFYYVAAAASKCSTFQFKNLNNNLSWLNL